MTKPDMAFIEKYEDMPSTAYVPNWAKARGCVRFKRSDWSVYRPVEMLVFGRMALEAYRLSQYDEKDKTLDVTMHRIIRLAATGAYIGAPDPFYFVTWYVDMSIEDLRIKYRQAQDVMAVRLANGIRDRIEIYTTEELERMAQKKSKWAQVLDDYDYVA